MTLNEYLRLLRDQWLILAIALTLGLVGAAAAFVLRPAQYTATLTLYVSAQSSDSTAAAYQGAQLSQDRVASYTELLTSPRVATDVIRKLQIMEEPSSLAKQLAATSKADSVLIDVSATDRSPKQAADIVNAVGEVFPTLVSELERPATPGGVPAVAVRVVEPASIPTTPSTPGLLVTMCIGAAIGIFVGVGGAFIRNSLDTSVKSLEQLHDLTRAPNLGNIAHDPSVPRRPLTVHEDPQSPRSEAFRQLRTNLQFVDVDRPRKVLVVTSSMPAEGKTTTLVNLAIAMASAGTRVLVVEADLRRPKVSELLGLERTAGLTNVLSGRTAIDDVLQVWGGGMFDVIASGPLPPNPSELLASKNMEFVIRELRDRYDVVLIDSPPLLPVTDAAAVAPYTDGAILVCRFKATTSHQVEFAAAALKSVGTPILGTVFTMIANSGSRAYAQYNRYYQSEEPKSLTTNYTDFRPAPSTSKPLNASSRRPSPTSRRSDQQKD